jgi:hypothetical protein
VFDSPRRLHPLSHCQDRDLADEATEEVGAFVVMAEAGGARVLEATDLVRTGVATRMAVLASPADSDGREFICRGVPYADRTGVSSHRLPLPGVPIVDRIARADLGTTADVNVFLPGTTSRTSV